MDYKERYEKALERAKQLYSEDCSAENKDTCEFIFPELKESEDERIRKEIISFIEYEEARGNIPDGWHQAKRPSEWIAWLEKQKVLTRQPRDWSDADERMSHPLYLEGFDVGRKVGKIEAEQKPAEKQDYSGLTDLERAIHRGFLSAGIENVPVTIIKETAKECLAQQKPVWSEEDEAMRNNIIRVLSAFVGTVECDSNPSLSSSYPTYLREISWLKSLRPSWKPSEEQMGVDLEDEMEKFGERWPYPASFDGYDKDWVDELTEECAKHFYELGKNSK